MSDSPFQPARRFSPDIERCLFELAEQRMLLPARRAGYELQTIGVSVLPELPTEDITTQDHRRWRVSDPSHDPTAKQYGVRSCSRYLHPPLACVERGGSVCRPGEGGPRAARGLQGRRSTCTSATSSSREG